MKKTKTGLCEPNKNRKDIYVAEKGEAEYQRQKGEYEAEQKVEFDVVSSVNGHPDWRGDRSHRYDLGQPACSGAAPVDPSGSAASGKTRSEVKSRGRPPGSRNKKTIIDNNVEHIPAGGEWQALRGKCAQEEYDDEEE